MIPISRSDFSSQDLFCPRCLEWDHWEDTCPFNSFGGGGGEECSACGGKGHSAAVHGASKFKQRRFIVDTVGWQPFTEWFYESTFRLECVQGWAKKWP